MSWQASRLIGTGMSLRSAFDDILASQEPLGNLHDWIWQHLKSGTQSKRHVWNSGAFSTVEVNDRGVVSPRTRTVIVRKVDVDAGVLDFFTDVRSSKVHQLQFDSGNAEVCWLFYRASTKIQLRLEGTASLVSFEEDESAWNSTALRSRTVYASIEPPGLVRPSSQPPDTSDREVTELESERGRENFRVVRTRVRKADVLYLRDEGHVRARLDYDDQGNPTARWLVP